MTTAPGRGRPRTFSWLLQGSKLHSRTCHSRLRIIAPGWRHQPIKYASKDSSKRLDLSVRGAPSASNVSRKSLLLFCYARDLFLERFPARQQILAPLLVILKHFVGLRWRCRIGALHDIAQIRVLRVKHDGVDERRPAIHRFHLDELS